MELIETLWNVNMKLLLVLLATKQELIETLWNVNLVGVPDKSTTLSELI